MVFVAVLGYRWFFHWRSVPCHKFFLLFTKGRAAGSGLVQDPYTVKIPNLYIILSCTHLNHFFLVSFHYIGGTFCLVQCLPNLHVAFNNIISKVQGREAHPTDLELTHYRQSVTRKKTGEKGLKNLGHGTKSQIHQHLKNVP